MEEGNVPLITIITVVYNSVSLIEQTIRSVIDSNYPNLLYIVIDGGSTDGTIDILRRYDPHIEIWTSEGDNGIYDAMNKGWKLVRPNSYILFLGAGDKLLSLPLNLPSDYSVIIYGDVFIGDKLFKSSHNFKLKLGNTLHHQALLVPKKLSEQPPFDINYKLYADFDFNQRLLLMNVDFKYCKELRAYALPGGISSNRIDKEMLAVVKKNFGSGMRTIAYLYYKMQKIKGLF